jgi:cytochrome P450
MENRRPNGPKGHWLYGNVKAMRTDPLAFWSGIAKEYGDISFLMGGKSEVIYLINDIDTIHNIFVTDNKNFTKSTGLDRTKPLLGEGLLTSEGDFHKRQRRLVMPAFHRQRIHEYGTIMSDFSRQHAANWADGDTLDMSKEMMVLTLKIVGKTLYDTDVSKEATQVGEIIDTLLDGWWLGMLLPEFVFDILLKMPLPMIKQFHKAIEDMDALIYRLIQERRESGEDHGDLLSMLLKSVDEEDGGQMTDKQARDEAITLFLAGHETTATALAWTWMILSSHPEVVSKMQHEVDALGGRLPGMDDMANLEYTQAVLKESMRLYPPAWAIGRRTINEYDALGYTIPAGATVFVSPYVVHRDPRHYDNPEEFRPERWLGEEKAKLNKHAYIPFGGGMRRCIGEAFAMMEGVLVLATIAQEWSFAMAQEKAPIPHPRITLRAKDGIKMKAMKRLLQKAA